MALLDINIEFQAWQSQEIQWDALFFKQKDLSPKWPEFVLDYKILRKSGAQIISLSLYSLVDRVDTSDFVGYPWSSFVRYQLNLLMNFFDKVLESKVDKVKRQGLTAELIGMITMATQVIIAVPTG